MNGNQRLAVTSVCATVCALICVVCAAAPVAARPPGVADCGTLYALDADGAACQTARVPVALVLGSLEADRFAFSVQVTPTGAASSLVDPLDFEHNPALRAPQLVTPTDDGIVVAWLLPLSAPVSGPVWLGNLLVPVPCEAAPGDRYDVCMLSTGASLGPDEICVDPGDCATLTVVQTWFEDDDPAISPTGAWSRYNHPSASDGHLHYSTQTGARADFTFRGTGLRWWFAKGPMAGKADLYLNGTFIGRVDLYSPSLLFGQSVGKEGLPQAVRTITVVVSGQKNPSSTGYLVDIDAFEVVP